MYSDGRRKSTRGSLADIYVPSHGLKNLSSVLPPYPCLPVKNRDSERYQSS